MSRGWFRLYVLFYYAKMCLKRCRFLLLLSVTQFPTSAPICIIKIRIIWNGATGRGIYWNNPFLVVFAYESFGKKEKKYSPFIRERSGICALCFAYGKKEYETVGQDVGKEFLSDSSQSHKRRRKDAGEKAVFVGTSGGSAECSAPEEKAEKAG